MEFSILISTINRTDLKFLNQMFPGQDLSKLKLVIVNQTSKDKQIESSSSTIKVINSFEMGLSKSRNLALSNCTTKYGLIADDDLIYESNFYSVIKQAINNYQNYALLCFELTYNGKPFSNYAPNAQKIKSKKQINAIASAEMLVNVDLLKKNKLKFNPKFGLNAIFPMGEEQVLALELQRKGLHMQRVNQVIAQHNSKSSGHDPIGEDFIKTAIAIRYLYFKDFIYLWIVKYLFFLWRKKYITTKQVGSRFIQMKKHLNFVKKHL